MSMDRYVERKKITEWPFLDTVPQEQKSIWKMLSIPFFHIFRLCLFLSSSYGSIESWRRRSQEVFYS